VVASVVASVRMLRDQTTQFLHLGVVSEAAQQIRPIFRFVS